MLKDNLGIRLFALFLAIIIWLQSVLVSEQRTVVSLPVNLLNMPQSITLENIPDQVAFNVKGKGLDILRLAISKPKVSIDASDVTPYTDVISLQNYAIDIPENLNVSFLGPAESDKLAIQADVFHQKEVPVELVFDDPTTQTRLNEMRFTLSPQKVTVFGPRNKIRSIKSIKTQAVDQTMLIDARVTLDLELPDENVNASDKTVILSISGIRESTKVFTNIELPDIYTPTRVAIKLSGTESELDKLQHNQIKPVIDPEADENGFYKVNFELPEQIRVIAITPSKVRKQQ
jgi:YbbR domain-containing protein